MSLKGLLFIGLFSSCTIGALFLPQLGIYGYLSDYCIGSASQWWARPFQGYGIRYSFTLALATAIGIFLNRGKLRYGQQILHKHEQLIILFLGIMFLSSVLGEATTRVFGATLDSPLVKSGKMVIFMFMMTHVITDRPKFNGLLLTLITVCLYLGFKAWEMPRSAFVGGRLEGLGGTDFHDANRFGGFMAGMLFLIGLHFVRSGLVGRVWCFLAGAFSANAVILTRSRGALLGIVMGLVVAVFASPKEFRGRILVGIVCVILGFFSIMDPQSIQRSSTVVASSDERDESSLSRFEIWEGGVKMLIAHPLIGVGPGNFHQNIGRYQPKHSGRDAHNTFIRCAGELGIAGLSLLLLIVANAYRILIACIRDSAKLLPEVGRDMFWVSYGCMAGLTAVLAYGMTGTLLYSEYFWLFLTLPVCIRRIIDNEFSEVGGQLDELAR